MTTEDRTHWDEKYRGAEAATSTPSLPERFEPHAARFVAASSALEIACGAGTTAVWLASNGVAVTGYDISPVAISAATSLAAEHGVSDRCRFATHDFDHGLPAGDPVDLVVCNMFRDASLDEALVARLRPGGILAIAALSEVGATSGRFRVPQGELTRAFGSLEHLDSHEADGVAWLVAQRP